MNIKRKWHLLLALFCFSLFLQNCDYGGAPTGMECTNGYSTTTIPVNGFACKEDCDCSNQTQYGICVNNQCSSKKRSECQVKGLQRHCTLNAKYHKVTKAQLNTCSQGIQTCQDKGLNGLKWGNCRPYKVVPKENTKALCSDGKDNDCDGKVDRFDAECRSFCYPGQKEVCYNPAPDTQFPNRGECRKGQRVCQKDLTWGECKNYQKPSEEKCDKLDNDCDGLIDEYLPKCKAVLCKVGEKRPCYNQLIGCDRQTDGQFKCKGGCRAGYTECKKDKDGKVFWDTCQGQETPKTEDCNDQIDNDCDGLVNEDCVCQAGKSQPCFTGHPSARHKGSCSDGVQKCQNGFWGVCQKVNLPKKEDCNGKDDDCDGLVDENEDLALVAPHCEKRKGVCLGATKICGGHHGWLPCTDRQYEEHSQSFAPGDQEAPGKCDLRDNNCNGLIDEGCATCKPGMTRPCRTAPESTKGKGICKPGTQSCNGGLWSPQCIGEVLPQKENCSDGQDNDCNGKVDDANNCPECKPGQLKPCYDGDAKTINIGICKVGFHTCDNNNRWSKSCERQVLPKKEDCSNKQDDDCDGKVDNGTHCPECLSTQTRSCYLGPKGTEGVGECRKGVQYCLGNKWEKSCRNQILPRQEICGDKKDNDCDGKVDETTQCIPKPCSLGETRRCYTGPKGTQGAGLCKQGWQSCLPNGNWGSCTQQTIPTQEVCHDQKDNDCDGQVDENCEVVTEPPPPEDAGSTEGPKPVCVSGKYETCTTHSPGICKDGKRRCVKGQWGPCISLKLPEANEKCDGLDNNCNGLVDEDYALFPKPPACKKQLTTCKGAVLRCTKAVYEPEWSRRIKNSKTTDPCQLSDYIKHDPRFETVEKKCDGLDNDCNGKVDEQCSWAVFSGKSEITGNRIITDSKGYIYVLGTTKTQLHLGPIQKSGFYYDDLFIAKFDPKGKVIWATRGGGSYAEYTGGITLDESEKHVYISGTYHNTKTPSDVRFGNEIISPSDISGGRGSGGGGQDGMISKLDAKSGQFIWTANIGGTRHDRGQGIIVNNTGIYWVLSYGSTIRFSRFHKRIIVPISKEVSFINSNPNREHNLLLIKLKEVTQNKVLKPQLEWVKSIASSPKGVYFGAFHVDKQKNIILTGGAPQGSQTSFGSVILKADTTKPPWYNMSTYLAKVSPGGKVLWTKRVMESKRWRDSYYGLRRDNSIGAKLIVDAKDNIYIAGVFSREVVLDHLTLKGQPTGDFFVAKLDPTGKAIWANSVNSQRLAILGFGLQLSSTGKVIVGGRFQGSSNVGSGTSISFGNISKPTYKYLSYGNNENFLGTLDTNGKFIWGSLFGSTGGKSLIDITLDNSITGNLYVTGSSLGIVQLGNRRLKLPTGGYLFSLLQVPYCGPTPAIQGFCYPR